MSIASTPERPGGRRERRRAATRRRLQDSALQLALEHGVESLTVERISDAADIAPRTFFHYFPSKEDALLPTDLIRLDELRAALAGQPDSGDPVAAVWRALAAWAPGYDVAREDAAARLRLAAGHPGLLPRFLARFAAVEEIVAADLARRLGSDPAGLRASVLAAVIVAAFRTAVHRWALDPACAARTLAEVAGEASEVVFGAAGRPGPGGS
jgi:AcrR family transcriptional regulator